MSIVIAGIGAMRRHPAPIGPDVNPGPDPEANLGNKIAPPTRVDGALCRARSGGQTAIFNSLDARKATFLLALILIASPVAGLRPMRAARFLT
jgi:hypothetical protein